MMKQETSKLAHKMKSWATVCSEAVRFSILWRIFWRKFHQNPLEGRPEREETSFYHKTKRCQNSLMHDLSHFMVFLCFLRFLILVVVFFTVQQDKKRPKPLVPAFIFTLFSLILCQCWLSEAFQMLPLLHEGRLCCPS